MLERPQWTERTELLSELHTLLNHLMAEVAEVKMAIQREENAFEAKRAKTVTQQTKELLNRSQRTVPPYENLLQ